MLGSLLGNYRVIEALGEGGMGIVYVGRHETLGRRVVVKVLRPDMSCKADMIERFFNEAQAATAINNPGIAQVFDFGMTPDGQAYFVMELLEGETLAARLRQGRMDPGACCRIGRQIANVLQVAHEAGITHRDLKPDNLFLVPDREVFGGERVKVLDFGLAKLANEARPVQTRTGLVMGTPSYMSPEQCRGIRNADARSDIYSLGCIIFKMACGRAPFVGDGAGDVVVAHVQEPVPDPRDLAPDLPAGLAALIRKMLAKNPSARPQTMAAVSQAFDEILGTLGAVPAHTPVPPPPVVPAPAPTPTPAPEPAPPEDPPSLTLADPIRPMTMDDTLLAPAPPSEDSTTQVPGLPREPEPAPAPALDPEGTPSSPAEITGVPRLRSRRLPLVIAGLLVAGAAAALAIVIATRNADVRTPASAAGEAGSAAPATGSASVLAPAPVKLAEEIEARCRARLADRKWTKLRECAEELKLFTPDRAEELRFRAEQEIQSAGRVAAVEAALREDNLKKAKAELEYVWPESVESTDIKRRYAMAEAQAISDLAAELARVKDVSCRKYNAMLDRERTRKPVRVTEEAARRTPCTPPPKCDAEALARQGQAQLEANQVIDAFMAYDAAYVCNPGPARALKAFTLACTLHNLAKSRWYWRQLAPALRVQNAGTCVRNGITAAALNAP